MGNFTKKERLGLLTVLGIAMLISLFLFILKRNNVANSNLQQSPLPSSNVILVKDSTENTKTSSGKKKRKKSKGRRKKKKEAGKPAPDFRDMEEDTIPLSNS